jgi:hypothetical protein
MGNEGDRFPVQGWGNCQPYLQETGESTHPMKERAIFIFELVEKEEREKKVGQRLNGLPGATGSQCGVFKLRQNGSFMRNANSTVPFATKKQKGYPTLVSSF